MVSIYDLLLSLIISSRNSKKSFDKFLYFLKPKAIYRILTDIKQKERVIAKVDDKRMKI